MRLALLLFFICLCIALTAQTSLTPGDLAVVGYASDTPDEVCLVALAPIEAGTMVTVTDDAWEGDDTFRESEGTTVLTLPALSFGDVYCVEDAGLSPALAAAGDQIFLYTGTEASPTFIYAFQYGNADWLTTGAPATNNSYLPLGTVDGTTAFNIGATDTENGYYSGPPLVDQATALTAIANPANWTTSNTRVDPSSSLTITLPVSLTALNASKRGKTAIVKWSTATESGNSHFVVERSQDGLAFNEVGRISGAGDSQTAINYNFSDQAPATGENYYRLRQVDLTGASTLFGPVLVSFASEGLTAFPNPVGDRLFVSGPSENSRTTILDLNGRVLSSKLVSGDGIATDALAPGTYLLRVENAAGIETLRFVKQ